MQTLTLATELAKSFGSDATAGSLRIRFVRQVTPQVKRIQECVKAGGDRKDLNIGASEVSSIKGSNCWAISVSLIAQFLQPNNTLSFIDGRTEMARIFGSDCTANGLKFQFTDRIRPLGRQQLAMLNAGKDPKDLDLGTAKGAKGNGQNS